MTSVPKRTISRLEHRALTGLMSTFVIVVVVLFATHTISSYNNRVRTIQEDLHYLAGGEQPIRFSGGGNSPKRVPGLYAVSLLVLIAILFGRTFLTSSFLTLVNILLVLYAINRRAWSYRDPDLPPESYIEMWLYSTLNVDFIALLMLPTLLIWQITILIRIYGPGHLTNLK